MPTTSYSLKNTYNNASKVSASDLNRRADILAFQLPGALMATAIEAGVLPLVQTPASQSPNATQSAAQSLTAWANAAATALEVTSEGTLFKVAAGAALVRHPVGHLVWTTAQNGLSIAKLTPEEGETLYVHLALAIPDDETEVGALDSQIGAAPTLMVTELETESGALLLASWDGTTLIDRRTFIAPAALALGGLTARVEAIETSTGGGEGGESVSWLSQLLYNVGHPVQVDVYIDGRLSEIEARLEQNEGGTKKFPDELSLLTDLTSAIAVGVFEINPPALLRTQMSALGRGFGKGQNSTPDLSPNTDDPQEATYEFSTGLITP
jgi:hypothetical protein